MLEIFEEKFQLDSKEANMFNAIYTSLRVFKPILFDKCIQTAIISCKIAHLFDLADNTFKIAALSANLGLQASSNYIEKDSFINDQELSQIHRHPILSAEILNRMGYCDSAKIVYFHHELPNGKGYYKSMTHSKQSDIINIADTFQGCIYNKTYKVPLTLDEALKVALFNNYANSAKFSKEEVEQIKQTLIEVYNEFFEFDY